MTIFGFKVKPIYLIIVLIIAYATYFSYYSILKHYTFHSFAYDLGIFTQYLWSTMNGYELFYSSVIGSTVWAWHFQPILFLILPFYALIPKIETLLVLQSVVLAIGALPIYLIARDELGEKMGLVFAIMYLLYPALHGVNSFDFHPEVLTLPVILFSFYMFRKKHFKRGFALAVLAMMGKETIPLTILFMSLYFLWVERKKFISPFNWKGWPKYREITYPLILSLVSALWAYLAVQVIIPHFSLTGIYPFFDLYGYGNIFTNIVTDIPAKLNYLFLLFAPLFFFPLFNPSTLLISLPIFAIILLTGHQDMYRIVYHYSAEVIPWLFISSIFGVKWLSVISRTNVKIFLNRLFYILLPATIIVTLFISPVPISFNQDMFELNSHHTRLNQAIDLIPIDASVYTQNDLFPHICERINAYSQTLPANEIFKFYNGNYDYILDDSSSEQSVLKWADSYSLERLAKEYGIYAQGDKINLYKKGYSGEPIALGD